MGGGDGSLGLRRAAAAAEEEERLRVCGMLWWWSHCRMVESKWAWRKKIRREAEMAFVKDDCNLKIGSL